MIRVVIQQPALASYRRPLYEQLAAKPDLDILVDYGDTRVLPNVDSGDFNKRLTKLHVWNFGLGTLYWHWAQIQYASRKHCDVLVLCSNVRFLSLIPALIRAKFNGVPTLLWTHGYSKNNNAWSERFRARVYRLGSGLLLYGYAAQQPYLNAGWPRDRVFVAPNSLDQDAIHAAREDWLSRPADLRAFQEQHQLTEGPNLLYLGRLYESNNLMILVEALPALTRKFPGLQIILIGKGDEEQQRLSRRAEALNVGEHLRFLGAIYEESAIAPWALSCQAMVYPQNIGLSILHAMGYGLPVITSDDIPSHNPEIEAMEPGISGMLYAHANGEALTDVLMALLSDRSRCQAMGQAALKRVNEHYNMRIMSEKYAEAIRQIVGSARHDDGEAKNL